MESKSHPAKRIAALLLCAAMGMGILTSCASSGAASSAAASSAAESSEASSAADSSAADSSAASSASGEESLHIDGGDGVELTYWIPMSSDETQKYSSLAEHPFFQWMEKETGVKIKFIHPTSDQTDSQLTAMIASGNFYDMLYSPYYPGGPQTGIDEKCFVDLNQYLDKYMPDYKAALNCSDGSFASWEWGSEKDLYKPAVQPRFLDTMLTKSGALWCVSQIFTDQIPTECGPVIRKDWLDEAGLQIPETLDDLEKVLAAFAKRGSNVIPITLGQTGTYATGAIETALGVHPDFSMSEDKKTILPNAATQPEFKDYLTLLNKWYKAGYIDKDFMNHDSDALSGLFLNDEIGVYMDSYTTPEDWKAQYKGSQKFDVACMPLPRKTTDQQLDWLYSYDSEPYCWTCITTSCKHPEIAAAWLNTLYKKSAILRSNYGVEGETYELKDGVPYFTEKALADKDFSATYVNTGFYSTRASMMQTLQSTDDPKTVVPAKVKAGQVWSQNASAKTKWVYTVFEGDTWGEYDKAWTDANTYANPMILNFIIGQESLDKFDAFVAEGKTTGFDKAREIAQEQRDKMTASK